MRLVYFSHSYRPEDQSVNDFFSRLLETEELLISLDPPSPTVNAAKLQRHLNSSDAMVAILTRRGTGVSPYILFEISLCLRSRKPLLVFLEDVLPDGLVPRRVLQRRFSRGAFLRQVREHRHALQVLKTYVGAEPPPRYQPDIAQRSCVVVGDDALGGSVAASLEAMLTERGYRPLASSRLEMHGDADVEALAQADTAVAFVDAGTPAAHYARGLLHGASVPTIEFTCRADFPFDDRIPLEFQPGRLASAEDWEAVGPPLEEQLAVTEENFLELLNDEQLEAYLQSLVDVGQAQGRYSYDTRERLVKVVMGDEYTVGQAGAVGPGSRAENFTFHQTWNQMPAGTDAAALAEELGRLRQQLRQSATEPEHDIALAEVAEAEVAARAGDGPQALERLSRIKRLPGLGKWVLTTATTIGTTVAAAAVKVALGL